jgi:hypothetical protein
VIHVSYRLESPEPRDPHDEPQYYSEWGSYGEIRYLRASWLAARIKARMMQYHQRRFRCEVDPSEDRDFP